MTCLDCPNATMVHASGGMYIECAAIQAMSLPPARLVHPRHRVLVYMGQVFIPKECPNPEVPCDLKTQVDPRKTQPCRDENGAILPRRKKLKAGHKTCPA